MGLGKGRYEEFWLLGEAAENKDEWRLRIKGAGLPAK